MITGSVWALILPSEFSKVRIFRAEYITIVNPLSRYDLSLAIMAKSGFLSAAMPEQESSSEMFGLPMGIWAPIVVLFIFLKAMESFERSSRFKISIGIFSTIVLYSFVLIVGQYRWNQRLLFLATHGISVTGQVLSVQRIYVSGDGKDTRVIYKYVLRARYLEHFSVHLQSFEIDEDTLRDLKIADGQKFERNKPIALLYDPEDPSFFRIAGAIWNEYLGYGRIADYARGGYYLLLGIIVLWSARPWTKSS